MKKEMKKNLFMLAAVALMSFTACNKEEVSVENPVDNQTPATVVEFTASFATTKTALDNTGAKTLWVESDRIDINGQEFKIKELIDGGLSAKFENVNDLPGDFAAPFTATYPYGVTEVPAAQTAKAGTFDPAAVLETAESDDYTLSFKNVTSLLKFQVATACETVTITSSDALAGSSAKTVTVTGPFVTGKTYYAAVLPGKKADFVVRMDGYLSKNAASVTVGESTIANMGTLPAPVKSDWGIVGAANGWNEKSPIAMYKDVDDYIVVHNFSGGAFKFVKGTSWDINRGIRSCDASSPSKGKWNLCGTKDITLSNGDYDIYFSPEDGVFNYVDKGANVDRYVPSGKAIYLQVKEWSADDAYFEAWVWGSTQTDAWYKFAMTGEEDNNHYVIYVPNDATGMKILRKDPTSKSGEWQSWNDSGNQTIPASKNMFIENGWGTYSWGTY